jgi:membrane protein YqaA with SNARE-associated domain
MTIILALLVSAFLSATLLPGSSEAALVAALGLSDMPGALLIAVATIGNTLGACVNWLLGVLVVHGSARIRLPVGAEQLDRFGRVYARFGVWSLLLSWVPVVGDPLTVLAGLAKTPLALFIPLVAAGKLARYIAVAGVAGQFM